MQVNWMVISCFLVVFMIISGFSRGWWKEAITSIALAFFIFFLQNPDWAEIFIGFINSVTSTVWGYLPSSLITLINDLIEPLFQFTISSNTFQFDANSPGSWLTLLIVVVGASILLSRASLGFQPTALGKFTGAFLGGENGFLILNLVREYLDGRALPGQQQTASSAAVTVVGSNTYSPPAQNLAIQFNNLPDYTILDSVIPWVLIGAGVVLLVVVLKTRLTIASSPDGRKIQPIAPPFYKTPPAPPRRLPRAFVEIPEG